MAQGADPRLLLGPTPGVGGAPWRPHHWPVTRDVLSDQLLSRGEHLVLNPFEAPRCPRFSKEKIQEQDLGGSRAPRAPWAWRCFLSPSYGPIATQEGRPLSPCEEEASRHPRGRPETSAGTAEQPRAPGGRGRTGEELRGPQSLRPTDPPGFRDPAGSGTNWRGGRSRWSWLLRV